MPEMRAKSLFAAFSFFLACLVGDTIANGGLVIGWCAFEMTLIDARSYYHCSVSCCTVCSFRFSPRKHDSHSQIH